MIRIFHRHETSVLYAVTVVALGSMLIAAAQIRPVAPPAPRALVAPTAPDKLRILPDYSGTKAAVVFFEDKSNNETGFEVERKEGAGAYAKVKDLAAAAGGTVEWTDTPLDGAKTYTYRVRAKNADGNSGYTNECTIDFATVWPTPEAAADIEILHSFGDGLGLDGERMHHGVDIQGGDGGQDVKTARCGLIFAKVGAGQNQGVWMMHIRDGQIWFWHANHLEAMTAITNVTYGTQTSYVTATSGTKVGEITRGTWDAPWRHTHIQYNQNGVGGGGTWTARIANTANFTYAETTFQHPLSMYTTNALKDPKQKKPGTMDYDGDLEVIVFNKQSDGSDYAYDYDTKPLAGDIDIAIEIYDEMGTDPSQTADVVKYWIEGPNGQPAVRSAAQPYTLVNFSQNFMLDANWNTIYDSNRPGNPPNYPWTNYHHYIVTNTKSGNGQPASLDPAQYWNTNAEEDNSDVNDDTANFAGYADATKAEDARFPDGDYKVHVLMSDLVNSNQEEILDQIRVDNFPPAVKKIDESGSDALGDCMHTFTVTFSEPIQYTVSDVYIQDEHGDPVAIDIFPSDNDTVLTIVPEVPLTRLESYTLVISRNVVDKSNKKLDSRFGNANHNGTGGEAGDDVKVSFCACQDSADLDSSGTIDSADVDIFLEAFGSEAGDANYVECLDYDLNGEIDFIDWQVFLSLM